MLKRISCVVFAVILVMSLAVPAFAVSSGSGKMEEVYYPSFPIDAVQTYFGDVVPWPSAAGSKGDDGSYDFNGKGVYGSCSWMPPGASELNSHGSFITGITVFDGLSVNDYGSLVFVSSLMFFGEDASFCIQVNPSDLTLYQIVFECELNYLTVNDSATYYVPTGYTVRKSINLLGSEMSSSVDIAELLRDELFSHYPMDVSCVMVSDLRIEVDYQRKSVSTPYFVVTESLEPTHTSHAGLFMKWVNEHKLYIPKSIDGGFDMTSWLVTSIGSFLDFEFAPGFSLNKILSLFIIIALVLFFIKIFS